MIDSYIILNKNTNIFIKIFLYNILFLLILVTIGIHTIYYQTYFQFHSKISNYNSFYYFEVWVPEKEVEEVTNKNKIIIDSKMYNYQILEIDSNIVYQNNINYQKIYLEIEELDNSYKKNGYELEVKIPKEKKKIIDYLKE